MTTSNLLRTYGIPPKFSTEYKLPAALEPFRDCRRGLCLTGPSGVGKTTALALLVRGWVDANLNRRVTELKVAWKFISFPEFVMELQDAFKRDSDTTPLQLLRSYASAPHLIIDDLGAEKTTEFVRQSTYFLINHREMYLLPTFITTNFSMTHIDQNIDGRISSRIGGMCKIIRFEGSDRRLTK